MYNDSRFLQTSHQQLSTTDVSSDAAVRDKRDADATPTRRRRDSTTAIGIPDTTRISDSTSATTHIKDTFRGGCGSGGGGSSQPCRSGPGQCKIRTGFAYCSSSSSSPACRVSGPRPECILFGPARRGKPCWLACSSSACFTERAADWAAKQTTLLRQSVSKGDGHKQNLDGVGPTGPTSEFTSNLFMNDSPPEKGTTR